MSEEIVQDRGRPGLDGEEMGGEHLTASRSAQQEKEVKREQARDLPAQKTDLDDVTSRRPRAIDHTETEREAEEEGPFAACPKHQMSRHEDLSRTDSDA